MRFGVQLYGLMPLVRRDAGAVFDALAAMDCRMIEPCVAFGDLGGFEGLIWREEDYPRYAAQAARHGLDVPSCHVFAPDLAAAIPRLAAFAQRNALTQLVINCPAELSPEALRPFVDACLALAGALRQAGAQLLLHNGPADSAARVEDMSAYEWLLRACEGRVFAQPDIGWLLYGGVNPARFLWRNEGIVRSLHYKDISGAAGLTDAARRCVPLGRGRVDALACYQFARAAGVPQLIDQDVDTGRVLEDISDSLALLRGYAQRRDNTRSTLCVFDTATNTRRELRAFDCIVEAPNWLPGRESLLYNADGRIYRYDMQSDTVRAVDTGLCVRCNNDHVLSPDGEQLAVSHADGQGWHSRIYVLPLAGGTPRLVTPNAPSFLHGWSKDGELAYCAFRGEGADMRADVYAIPATGGQEKRLTFGQGFNDGPEYSPDGRYIYFNSTRSGLMQIWRMTREGGGCEQLTFSHANNWFAHLSPDGRQAVYLSYRAGDLDATEHLPNMRVSLWRMDADGASPRKLLDVFGGQGTINVNSWSGDSRRFAYVSYTLADSEA